jgi:hypothetical protein
LDGLILITIEVKLINTEHAKMSELIGPGMAIAYASLERARKYQEDLAVVLKELEHL